MEKEPRSDYTSERRAILDPLWKGLEKVGVSINWVGEEVMMRIDDINDFFERRRVLKELKEAGLIPEEETREGRDW